jgi:hypothetical protein
MSHGWIYPTRIASTQRKSLEKRVALTLGHPHVTISSAVSFSFFHKHLLPHAKALGLAQHLLGWWFAIHGTAGSRKKPP